MDPNSQAFLHLSEDDLLESIGAELAGRSALPRSRAELKEMGRAWYGANMDKIRGIVCPHRPELLRETNFEKLATVIADMLAAAFFSVTPFKIAILVTRIGVEKLCPLVPVDGNTGGNV